MDVVEFITQSLAQVQFRLLGTCEGLTQEQVLWRPTPYSNNIGFILWHMSRSEDYVTNRLRGNHPTLWVSAGWHQRFDQPEDAPDPGDKMGLQSLPIPDLEVLLGYSKAVHQQTSDFLPTLTAEALDQAPDPEQPRRTAGASLRHLITHKNNHHGQIDYIRGLQDEHWDLPPGTGIVLPTTVMQ
ncbi:MAG: DinB family protein [Dehalococcoidia bacterium]